MTPLLQPNCLVLTANSRLTRTLQALADQHHRQSGKQTWETPRILPLMSWLTQQFHQHNTSGLILLTDFQEQCVWENIIAQSESTPELLHPAQLATLVKEAYATLTLWQIPLEALEPFHAQLEVSCLIEWITAFDAQCAEYNWITTAALPQHIQTQELQKPLDLPTKIILSGFDTLNPSIEKLFAQLKHRVELSSDELTVPDAQTQQIILDDTESELMTMAKWMKAQWEKNPSAKLGCVIPELGTMRAQVERVMTSVFCIENILPETEIQYPPFNISAGMALSEHNMIHTALTLLTWCHQPLPIAEIAGILQSPYLCANEMEACNGAQIDAFLREQNRLTVSITDLFYNENPAVQRWRALLSCSREKETGTLKPSEWAQHFVSLLKIIQWPGSQTQSSNEFQALERFKKLLHSFSQLDLIFKKMPYPRALALLKTLSHNTIFQPKSHDEPIQIMGALESSGIIFDAVWVLGLHDGIWPPAAKPHPLIPYAIQQEYQTPHATSARELSFCEHVTKRLENSAKHVIFSSPKKQGDQHLFPSRLIAHIPMINKNQLEQDDAENYAEMIFNAAKTETLNDDKAPELTQFSRIHGGSNILKLQALCPFRAYASVRLKARALNQPTIGVSNITRGILTHQILYELWNTLKTQAALFALSDTELNQLIEATIEKTFSDKPFQVAISENQSFFDIEKKRLQTVIFDWMQLEKLRPAFSVNALESSANININQLPINIRLDRIDELQDGSLMLIDYKTGKNNINAIMQEELTDPQLPIYAVFHDKNTQFEGVAFAGVNQADMGYNGITHENKTHEKNRAWYVEAIHQKKNDLNIDNWKELVNYWKKSLTQLADDFCAGDARVNPLEPSTCEHCEMKTLCRRET